MFPIGANSNHSLNDDVEIRYIQKRKKKNCVCIFFTMISKENNLKVFESNKPKIRLF